MPTSKKRTNISLDDQLDTHLTLLAKRDNVPKATKAAQLIRIAVEIDEDDYLDTLANERDTQKAEFVEHEEAWL